MQIDIGSRVFPREIYRTQQSLEKTLLTSEKLVRTYMKGVNQALDIIRTLDFSSNKNLFKLTKFFSCISGLEPFS